MVLRLNKSYSSLGYLRGLGQSASAVQSMIQSTAAGYNIPGLAQVATAVASHESQFQPGAQNPGSSAAGVFQLISATQQTMGVTNPYDAQQNVQAGVGLLAQYYQQYGNWNQALQAFSDGPGTVQAGLAPSAQTIGLIGYVNSYPSAAGTVNVAAAQSGGNGTVNAGGNVNGDVSGGAPDVSTVSGLDLSWMLGDPPGTDVVDWTVVALVAGAVGIAAVAA